MVRQPSSFGIFPSPFSDETCYSLLCRYSVRRGRLTSNQICLDLFGHTEPLSGYMFKPFRMEDIKRWFRGWDISLIPEFGSAHSCYPFYTVFLAPADAAKVRDCHTGSTITSGQAKRINRKCGFPKGHKKRLWYCPVCVQEDIASRGETCWRRLPQMPGAVYCPVHRERFHESGVSFREIDYRIIPATYALIHSPEPEHERGDIYRDRYIKLAEDIAFLLDNGFSAPDRDWLTDTHLKLAGESIDAHLLYVLSRSPWRKNRFEDYLAAKLIKDSGKEKIEETVSRQISWLISIEKHFGSIRKFCSG